MGAWKNLAKGVLLKAVHPIQTTKNLLNVGQKTVVLTGVGYVGWQKLTTDKSVARIVSEVAIGEDAVNTVVGVADDISDLKNDAGETLGKVNNTLDGMDHSVNGVKKFFAGLSSGNGGSMLGDFFSNLTSGKVSGLGIAGLIGAALLAFGRFGWFGKIAGALLGMFIIGNNFDLKRVMGGDVAQEAKMNPAAAGTPYSKATVYSPKDDLNRVFIKGWDASGKDYPAVELTREQYDNLVEEGYSAIQIYQGMSEVRKQEDNRGTAVSR